MNITAIVLLASLLCAECPACSMEERWLIAQTVVYRAEAKSLSIDEVIREPNQYQGLVRVDIPAYRRLRAKEWGENLGIAWSVIRDGPVVKVSHFASSSPEWAKECELKYIMAEHKFWLCLN